MADLRFKKSGKLNRKALFRIILAIIILIVLWRAGLFNLPFGGGEEPEDEIVVENVTTPTIEPTEAPTTEPTVTPTAEPTAEATVEPTPEPTKEPTKAPTKEPTVTPTKEPTPEPTPAVTNYKFRNKKLLDQHYEKHGIEMGFASAKEYEKAASAVINNPEALTKTEKEDGDYVYYVEASNEFVILSTDGYIRTYFLPSGGKKYYDKQ